MVLTLEQFVTWYRNKTKHNGQPFTEDEIMADSDMERQSVQAFNNYCAKYPNLTDAQLIALDPIILKAPFGVVINDKAPARTADSILDLRVGEVTVRELKAALGL